MLVQETWIGRRLVTFVYIEMTNIKLPLEILEKCVDRRLWVIMKDDREYSGKLRGFDGFFNMVLDDVTEIQRTPTGSNI